MKTWFLLAMVLMMAVAVLPASAWAEDDETSAENEIGWFGAMRAKMLARHYEIDETTAISFQGIIRDGQMEKKRLNNEVKNLLAEIELAVKGEPGVRSISELFTEIKTRKTALGGVDNTTLDRVVVLLGEQKAARWMLSQRGVMERVTGNVRRATQRPENEGTAEESTASERPARTRRGGSY